GMAGAQTFTTWGSTPGGQSLPAGSTSRWVTTSPTGSSAGSAVPGTFVAAPVTPQTPQVPTKEPAKETVRPPEVTPPTPQPEAEPSQDLSAAIGGEGFAGAAAGGYLDNAIPKTMFRLRYDAAFGVNRFDRADFLFGTWKELSFHPHGIRGDGAFLDPKA